jgi:hypothetical protein
MKTIAQTACNTDSTSDKCKDACIVFRDAGCVSGSDGWTQSYFVTCKAIIETEF